MALLRHRQRGITSVSPHPNNASYVIPSRVGAGDDDADYFIDGNAPDGGDGTLAAPWNDFIEINALIAEGGFTNKVIGLARGSIIYTVALVLDTLTNVTVRGYGTGANPIIDGSVDIGGTWTADPGTGPDVYYHSGTTQYHPIIDQVDMAFRPDENTGVANNTSWFGSPVASRLYVRTTTSPITATAVRSPFRQNNILIARASGVTVKDIDVQAAAFVNIFITVDIHNIVISGGVNRWCGVQGSTPSNLFNVVGNSALDMATGIIIENIEMVGSDGHGAIGNGIEMEFLSGAIIRNCTVTRINGTTIEFWRRCDDTLVENLAVWNTNNPAVKWFNTDGISTGTVVRNLTGYQRIGWNRTNTSQMIAMDSNSNTGSKVINCSFSVDGQAPLRVENGNSVEFINNIVHMKRANTNGQPCIFIIGDSGQIAGSDYNAYQTDISPNRWQDSVDGLMNNLPAWQASTGLPDPNATQEVFSGTDFFVDIDAAIPDFTPNVPALIGLQPSSDPDVPTFDINGDSRGPTVYAGAIKYVP